MVFTINADAEPIPNSTKAQHAATTDLNIFAGGSNVYPNAFYLPLDVVDKIVEEHPEKGAHRAKMTPFGNTGKPITERETDVLYRSSNCTPEREKLAAAVKKEVEARGMTFVSAGRCKAGDTPLDRAKWVRQKKQRGDDRGWAACPECDDAKMMIAFENYSEGFDYLCEKPFLAAVAGAIPLYDGNGLHLFEQVGMNSERMLVRGKDDDPAAFAKRVADVLQDPHELKRLYNLSVGEPKLMDTTHIQKAMCGTSKVKAMQQKESVCVQGHIPGLEMWLPDALCLDPSKVVFEECTNPDILVGGIGHHDGIQSNTLVG